MDLFDDKDREILKLKRLLSDAEKRAMVAEIKLNNIKDILGGNDEEPISNGTDVHGAVLSLVR